ncbi:MAG: hypothetical protein C4K58_05265 [Flavobacteriaceae bacterium]|nr:MAG: hypothetical protein C4K58_05265 [Flavobacteriaceae bacterium]
MLAIFLGSFSVVVLSIFFKNTWISVLLVMIYLAFCMFNIKKQLYLDKFSWFNIVIYMVFVEIIVWLSYPETHNYNFLLALNMLRGVPTFFMFRLYTRFHVQRKKTNNNPRVNLYAFLFLILVVSMPVKHINFVYWLSMFFFKVAMFSCMYSVFYLFRTLYSRFLIRTLVAGVFGMVIYSAMRSYMFHYGDSLKVVVFGTEISVQYYMVLFMMLFSHSVILLGHASAYYLANYTRSN